MLNLLFWWGLILTVAAAVWHGSRWMALKAQPFDYEDHGESYQCREERAKNGRLTGLLLSYKIPRRQRFCLRREGWFDLFGKATRLAVEPQARDSRFDSRVYVDSNDRELIALLQTRADLRSALLNLMDRVKAQGARYVSLIGEDGYAHLYLIVANARDPDRLRGECAAWLAPFLQALRTLPLDLAIARSGPIARLDKPRLLNLALFCIGSGAAAWIALLSPERLLDPWALFRFSLTPAAIATVLLLIWTVRSMAAVSNRHRALLEWLLLAPLGVVLCSFAAVRSIDLHFDFAAPQAIAVSDASIHQSYRRRRGIVYSVAFRSDHPAIGGYDSIVIDADTYQRLNRAWQGNTRERATLLLHPGVLGFAWKEFLQ